MGRVFPPRCLSFVELRAVRHSKAKFQCELCGECRSGLENLPKKWIGNDRGGCGRKIREIVIQFADLAVRLAEILCVCGIEEFDAELHALSLTRPEKCVLHN